MEFILSKDVFTKSVFFTDESTFPGVNRVARKVMKDIEMVLDVSLESTCDVSLLKDVSIIYGTAGNSRTVEMLSEKGLIDISVLEEKRESFIFRIVENPFENVKVALVIAGSDKLGTIYGLFHLSRLLGVSPFVNWANVIPAKKEKLVLTEKDNLASKEPSVRYRGFFINDEWPAFGNWTFHHFGGFTVEMYDRIFEILLRLNGNYLWPAMWSSCFSEDGPGLLNAERADEYGIKMGCSHHEPCCRHGEEYKHVRGKDSVYGDAWNFITNREGITRFWEDGLKRSGKFENVITVGMRGEADSAIMGKNATLKDNIDLLRDVLKTQNNLIRKYVNEDLDKVPRMLALYKEVEPYFYGDENTEGLIGSEELDGVTLMLCDDNHGNLRTLPTQDMLNHKGGYGMYYHFDYHGDPYSYEWVNTSYLPKVQQQMTQAYNFGIRDLWIVNVGDVATQEYPLSYFMDLAYDIEKYGNAKEFDTLTYTYDWVNMQFPILVESDRKKIAEVLNDYTYITHLRRTECLQSETFSPKNFEESSRILAKASEIMDKVKEVRKSIPEKLEASFYDFVYVPALGTMNVEKMQILTGKNHFYASLGCSYANELAEEIEECLEFDRMLVKEFDEVDGGRWYAMGWSEHIGFKNWNEEECQFPVISKVIPANKSHIIALVKGSSSHTSGKVWTGKTLLISDFRNPLKTESFIDLFLAGKESIDFEIRNIPSWLNLSKTSGKLSSFERITIKIDRSKVKDEKECMLEVNAKDTSIKIKVLCDVPCADFEKGTFIETEEFISVNADHYSESSAFKEYSFKKMKHLGKTKSAIKVMPETYRFESCEKSPYAEYAFVLQEGFFKDRKEDAVLCSLEVFMSPSNPSTKDNKILYGVKVNDGDAFVMNAVPCDFKVGEVKSFWACNVTDNIRKQKIDVTLRKGLNKIRFYGMDPCFILEKFVISPKDNPVPDSNLGPEESYRV